MQPVDILVVDDDPTVELLFSQKFKKQIRNGIWRLLFAQNGREALRQLETCPNIAVLISDLSMPDMDDLALLTHLKERYPLVRSIVMTAHSELPNIRAAMNKGTFDFLSKPLDMEDLKTTLDNAIFRHKQIVQEKREREQAEEALRRSERQYRELIRSVDTGIAIVQEGTLVFVNDALGAMFGETVEYLLQRAPESLLDTTEDEKHVSSRKSGSERQWHSRHITASG